jgi:hypothetical protein
LRPDKFDTLERWTEVSQTRSVGQQERCLGEEAPVWERRCPSGRGGARLGEEVPVWERRCPSGRGGARLGEEAPVWERRFARLGEEVGEAQGPTVVAGETQ